MAETLIFPMECMLPPLPYVPCRAGRGRSPRGAPRLSWSRAGCFFLMETRTAICLFCIVVTESLRCSQEWSFNCGPFALSLHRLPSILRDGRCSFVCRAVFATAGAGGPGQGLSYDRQIHHTIGSADGPTAHFIFLILSSL
jgi:hypothetical protein